MTDSAPVENNSHLNLICPSSGKTVKVPLQCNRVDNRHPLYSLQLVHLLLWWCHYSHYCSHHYYYYPVTSVLGWNSLWQMGASFIGLLYAAQFPCHSECIWDGLLFEQRQPDHNLSVYLVAVYHQSSLPVLLGPNYLWSWQYGLTCLVMNATITMKALLSWMVRQQEFWLVKNSIN